jgi:hypothetical protein
MRYLILLLLSSLEGCTNAVLKNAFYRVGEGALGMSLWNQGCSGPKMFGNHWSIWLAIGNVIYILIHVLSKCTHAWLCVRGGKGQLVSECPLEPSPVVGQWLVVVRPLLSSKRRAISKLVKVWERTKYWSWLLMELKTKIDYAGQDQQQFYLTDWPHYPKFKKLRNIKSRC